MTDLPRFAVVIVAAGRGERAGRAEGPKQYRDLHGSSVIQRALRVFADMEEAGPIVVVIHPEDHDLLQRACDPIPAGTIVVPGGATRQQSVLAGLRALQDAAPPAVLIHDAARPFVDAALIRRVAAAVRPGGGALPALPIADTLKEVAGADVRRTVPRAGLYAAETPQGFPYRAILEAHEAASASPVGTFTDDASVAEWAGLDVRIVEGSPDNRKLTLGADIEAARERMAGREARMADIRTGHGYDVHRLVPGDHVVLCGVRIAHDAALDGHSDADVGLHALTDALLATCAAGDIGDHFPPSDPEWRGAASHHFVRHAASLVASKGGTVLNADISLICEAPRIGPHRLAMREAIAEMLGIDLERVSVKATTNETIGFVGRREGIAAIATASVRYGAAR